VEDTYHLWGLSPAADWIAKTWGGPAGLAAGGYAWGAFADRRLVSVACTFFVGDQYEEIGVVTEPAFRGQGLSAACAGALCGDILARGRRSSWTTSPDNAASLRVAAKLGFTVQRHDRLFVVGARIPVPARSGLTATGSEG
jgi:RimJ/RimL family protein N-acetyltransferase